MGHLRFNELALNDVADEASYEKYDLSEAGKLTALILKVMNKTAANLPVTEGRIIDHITKLEVMGKRDKTIKSISGLELQAINAYRNGRIPPRMDRSQSAGYCTEEFIIPFGRQIGDPFLYLDLAKDPDIDLKITNDFGTTYWTDGELKYTLHEIFLPETAPPEKGYVRSYEHSFWPSVDGSTESKKLTPGFNVFDVLLRGAVDRDATTGASATATYNVLREISVDFLNKAEVIIDAMEVRDLMYILGFMYGGPWRTVGQGYVSATGRHLETYLGYRTSTMLTDNESAAAGTFQGRDWDDEPAVDVFVDTAKNLFLANEGYLPYQSIMIPFDIGWPSTPLLDTEAKKPVYVRVHSHSSSGDVYMVVEELGSL